MHKPLSELKPGDSGTIVTVGGDGSLRRRLIAMGVTPGTWLTVRKYAPLGDPMEIRLRNYNLSIRKKDAAAIVILSEGLA
jgi:Fe2+ transport system protein FeoA